VWNAVPVLSNEEMDRITWQLEDWQAWDQRTSPWAADAVPVGLAVEDDAMTLVDLS
jgi:hypothetical protein